MTILKSLDRLVSLEDASPSNVDAVMKTEPSLDGKFKVDTNIEDLNSATASGIAGRIANVRRLRRYTILAPSKTCQKHH